LEADKEEKYIEQEKSKYSSADTTQHDFNAEMLKLAQVIDRESRVKKIWNEEDEDEDEGVFESDEESKEKENEDLYSKPKYSKRPAKAKYA